MAIVGSFAGKAYRPNQVSAATKKLLGAPPTVAALTSQITQSPADAQQILAANFGRQAKTLSSYDDFFRLMDDLNAGIPVAANTPPPPPTRSAYDDLFAAADVGGREGIDQFNALRPGQAIPVETARAHAGLSRTEVGNLYNAVERGTDVEKDPLFGLLGAEDQRILRARAADLARVADRGTPPPEGVAEQPRGQLPFGESSANTTPTVRSVDVQPGAAPQAGVGPIQGAGKPSVDLQAQQNALVADLISRAEDAGRQSISGLELPKFQLPNIRTDFGATPVPRREVSPLETSLNEFFRSNLRVGRTKNPLEGRLEEFLGARVGGGEDPTTTALLAELERQKPRQQEELTNSLNQLGITQQGDSVNVIGDFLDKFRTDRLGILAGGEDRKRAAAQQIQDFIGLTGGLDLGQQGQNLATAQAGQGFLGSRENLDITEAELLGNLRGAPTLSARSQEADIGVRLAQLAEGARQFEGGLGLERIKTQQDVRDRTLAALMTQTSPTRREEFEEGIRRSLGSEDLARKEADRAMADLESRLFGTALNQRTQDAGQALQGALTSQEIADMVQGRQLASRADIRAEGALGLESSRLGLESGRAAQETADAVQRRRIENALFGERVSEGQRFSLESELGRGQLALGQREALTREDLADLQRTIGLGELDLSKAASIQDIATAVQNRALASRADTRAGTALGYEGQRVANERSLLTQQIADMVQGRQISWADLRLRQSAEGRAELLTEQDIANAVQGRQLAFRGATREDLALTQQDAQFAQQLGLDYKTLSQNDRQFIASLAEQSRGSMAQERLSEGQLMGSLDGRATLADRELGFNSQQLERQRGQDNFLNRLMEEGV